ncbi:integrase family protein [Methylobacterium sp. WL6]|uniref:integrase family protein n=1 Tax=Methylobacterium sp. WL6 TaxID=2603901 RepID=UPI0011CA7E18|nr:integrase family protein [Methylobacterium sp. WL6]TXN73260.1 integrase family protein [Methylobacterium sp. WL6]
MPIRLSETIVKKALADVEAKRPAYDLIDGGCPGLLLRVGPRGARFSFKYESQERTCRLTLGGPATISLSEARSLASDARRRLVDRIGVPDDRWLEAQLRRLRKLPPKVEPPPRDPAQVEAFEDAWNRPGEWTWDEAKAAFLSEVARVRRPATHLDYTKLLRAPELAVFTGRRVRRIGIDDLATIVHAIHASGRERHAEHLASVLRPMWSYLARHENRKRSGVDAGMPGLRAPERTPGDKPRTNGKVPGGHVATPAEIGRVLAVARSGALEPTVAAALELLVLTGQRRRPIAEALAEDFVAWTETPGWGVWSMGPAHRKTAAKRGDKHRHAIPLPPGLWSLVQAQVDRGTGPFLFPQIRPARAGAAEDGHMNDSAMNARLLDMGVLASPHDLRRGLSTVCQRVLRIPRDSVKLVLDHNEGIRSDDVLERHYSDDDRLDLKQPLMSRWCAWADERATEAAAALPDIADLRAELARRRRARETAGKGKRALAAAAGACHGERVGERSGEA